MNLRKIKLVLYLCLVVLLACKSKKIEDTEKLDNDIPSLETGGEHAHPVSWIDRDTGHKIEKVTLRDGENRSFYFHNNPFLPNEKGDGWLMVIYGDVHGRRQLFSVDLQTKDTRQLTSQKGNISGEIVGVKSRKVFYTVEDSVFGTHVDSYRTELICTFPTGFLGSVTTINADETLLGFTQVTQEERELYKKNPDKGQYFNVIYEAKLPRTLWAIDIGTGEFSEIYSENAWLNHVQFSPTDPFLLMYCHEGPWHKVDRIWNIDIDSKEKALLHKRTVHREIAGHEFFSPDGKTIWFDLQIPRGETFFLAGKNLITQELIKYTVERDEWSIHYNISRDLKTFAGDGGDESQVAKAKHGRWIYHFTPKGQELISTKLVNMKNHNYKLEPNVHFSPDGENIIFRANFEGHTNIYSVEITKYK